MIDENKICDVTKRVVDEFNGTKDVVDCLLVVSLDLFATTLVGIQEHQWGDVADYFVRSALKHAADLKKNGAVKFTRGLVQ